jgi:hypothetical protein
MNNILNVFNLIIKIMFKRILLNYFMFPKKIIIFILKISINLNFFIIVLFLLNESIMYENYHFFQ